MKKVLLSILVLLILLSNSSAVFAKDKGKGGGAGRGLKGTTKVRQKGREPRIDVGEQGERGKAKRVRKEERRKMREMEAEGKKKAKGGEDVNWPGRKFGKGAAEEKQVGRGREHQQQLGAVRTQMTHEEAKHLRRQARLQRLRELAVEEGKTETIARIDKLIEKEQGRYGRKRQRMEKREEKVLQLAEESLREEGETATEEAEE